MNNAGKLSLKDLILNPKGGIKNANGWQRIWFIFVGILFVLHGLVFIISMPYGKIINPNIGSYEKEINDENVWMELNKKNCSNAYEVKDKAQKKHSYETSLLKKEFESNKIDLYLKIKQYEEELFRVETSGGKFGNEWTKVQDKINAYRVKHAAKNWSQDDVKYISTIPTQVLDQLIDCEKSEKRKNTSVAKIELLQQEVSNNQKKLLELVIYSVISFGFFGFGAYAFGSAVGWVVDGFRKNKY